MKKNVLSLADQIKVANYLNNNPPKAGESLVDITVRTGKTLDLVVTESNVRAVLGAVGLKSTGRAHNNKNVVIVEAILNLYKHSSIHAPNSLKELALSLGINS